jgi:hypothetical protein
MAMRDSLVKIIIAFGREDFFVALDIHEGQIVQAPFTLCYTIPRSSSKNIDIQSNNDYTTMMEAVTEKPRAVLTLTMMEQKVSSLTICWVILTLSTFSNLR